MQLPGCDDLGAHGALQLFAVAGTRTPGVADQKIRGI